MRILFLSGWFPYPPDNGARMRVYSILRQLARWHEIGLLSFVRGNDIKDDLSALDSFCQVLGGLKIEVVKVE